MSEFKDKVVVVTGGANGIGKCITEEFRKEGAFGMQINKRTKSASVKWSLLISKKSPLFLTSTILPIWAFNV